MYQNWRNLLFVHYAIEPQAIQRLLPPGLTVDTHPDADGREMAWLGVVCLLMENVRWRYLPAMPWSANFPELNLRTYVHINGQNPAVWFFSLDASSSLAVRGARMLYKLPYFKARMNARRDGDAFEYQSERVAGQLYPEPMQGETKLPVNSERVSLRARWEISGAPVEAKPESFEFWIAERYLLLAACGMRADGSRRYKSGLVAHKPYQLQAAKLLEWDDQLVRPTLGLEVGEPKHVCFSELVRTRVWGLKDCEG